MTKSILGYCTLINSICFIFSLLSLLKLNFKFNTIFFLLLTTASLLALNYLRQKKHQKPALLFLAFSSFLQSFTFFIAGILYKFVLGPNVTLYIYKQPDIKIRMAAKLYDVICQIVLLPDNGKGFAFGVNVIHFLLFIGFVTMACRQKPEKAS